MKTYEDQVKSTGVKYVISITLDDRPHVCIDWRYTDQSRDGGDVYVSFAFESESDAEKAFEAIDIEDLSYTFGNHDEIEHIKSLWINGNQKK